MLISLGESLKPFGFQVSGLGCQFSGFEHRVSSTSSGFRVPGFKRLVAEKHLGLRVWVSANQAGGFGLGFFSLAELALCLALRLFHFRLRSRLGDECAMSYCPKLYRFIGLLSFW